jgi:lysophospholipase L1-like esterase
VVLDGWEGVGDVSRDGAQARLAADGVHLGDEGQRELTRAWLEVLDPEGPWREGA